MKFIVGFEEVPFSLPSFVPHKFDCERISLWKLNQKGVDFLRNQQFSPNCSLKLDFGHCGARQQLIACVRSETKFNSLFCWRIVGLEKELLGSYVAQRFGLLFGSPAAMAPVQPLFSLFRFCFVHHFWMETKWMGKGNAFTSTWNSIRSLVECILWPGWASELSELVVKWIQVNSRWKYGKLLWIEPTPPSVTRRQTLTVVIGQVQARRTVLRSHSIKQTLTQRKMRFTGGLYRFQWRAIRMGSDRLLLLPSKHDGAIDDTWKFVRFNKLGQIIVWHSRADTETAFETVNLPRCTDDTRSKT